MISTGLDRNYCWYRTHEGDRDRERESQGIPCYQHDWILYIFSLLILSMCLFMFILKNTLISCLSLSTYLSLCFSLHPSLKLFLSIYLSIYLNNFLYINHKDWYAIKHNQTKPKILYINRCYLLCLRLWALSLIPSFYVMYEFLSCPF